MSKDIDRITIVYADGSWESVTRAHTRSGFLLRRRGNDYGAIGTKPKLPFVECDLCWTTELPKSEEKDAPQEGLPQAGEGEHHHAEPGEGA